MFTLIGFTHEQGGDARFDVAHSATFRLASSYFLRNRRAFVTSATGGEQH